MTTHDSGSSSSSHLPSSHLLVTILTYAMFFMFAMTTDAVGEIIKIAKLELNLTNTQASAFHWATMVAIAISGFFLGFLADRFGRKRTIILGLSIYGLASVTFMAGTGFYLYMSLLFISGLAIGIFKTAALALISDISTSTENHTSKMNAVEGFFGVGAIVGPMLVVYLNSQGISWTWLYLVAAVLCALMILAALFTQYPQSSIQQEKSTASITRTFQLLGNKYALGFSFAIAMYVASEVAIFVWLPSFLVGFQGSEIAMLFAAYAVMVFFVLRALGRFLGIWILQRVHWAVVMMVFSAIIFACFLFSALLGQQAAVFLLPLSGLFMSMIYPTLNSKGISCFAKADHGSVAGLILFFTAVAAALGPLAMAYVSDIFGQGDMRIGFYLATVFAGLLFASTIFNWANNPAAGVLQASNKNDYAPRGAA
jgi:MFS transporter, FHS family, L-fucose permease